jgi:hypothetical protein
MPKPQWLKDKEMDAQRVLVEPDFCADCIYFGKFVKMTKHKSKEHVEVHECDIHPNCLNTKYSICCDDYTHA